MLVSLDQFLFFFDLLWVSMTSVYFLRMKDCHLKNYVTYGLVEWCSLQIFMACKWLEQQIADVCNTIYVVFDKIKAVKRNWEIMTVIWTMTLFKYIPNLQNHMTVNEMRNKPDIQRLQMQFSSVTVSTLCSVEVIWRNYKINTMCNVTSEKLNLETLRWVNLNNY